MKVFQESRVALVTGAGRGIGAAIAHALAREGARVAVTDVDGTTAAATAKAIVDTGGQAIGLTMNVTDRASIRQVVDAVHQRWRRIDILVNNAGICPITPMVEISEAEWDKVLAVNLKGPFLCAQAVLPGMKAQHYGRIINIASVAGKMGAIKASAHYAASKGGLIALTFTLARLVAGDGITVNAVAPALTDTDMTKEWTQVRAELKGSIPVGRIGQPEDMAHAVVFLASDAASFITGEVLDVNGGQLMD